STLRRAKRYLNGLRAGLPPILHEVDLFDFFLLETIRISCPPLYADMQAAPWYYVPAWTFESQIRWPFSPTLNATEKYKLIKDHIDLLLGAEPQRDLLLIILQELCFVEVKNAYAQSPTSYTGASEDTRSKKRLTHIECFPRYFQIQAASGSLSDSRVEELLNQ